MGLISGHAIMGNSNLKQRIDIWRVGWGRGKKGGREGIVCSLRTQKDRCLPREGRNPLAVGKGVLGVSCVSYAPIQ